MKTILFFYSSKCFGIECNSYVCAETDITRIIKWQKETHTREVKDGCRIGKLTYKIVNEMRLVTY